MRALGDGPNRRSMVFAATFKLRKAFPAVRFAIDAHHTGYRAR